MKNSGVEWIGEIPDGWEVTRSKNIFAQRSSRGNDVEEQLAATQQHGMYPQKLLEGVVQVKEDTDLQQFKTVHKNDYVISLRSFQGGFEMSDYEGVCSPAYQVFYNTIPISYRYYKYLFKSDGFISKMNSLTVGIREGKNIQYKDFSNSPIIIPSKSTQQRIASYLDKKCSKIEETIQNQQQVIEKLKAYKQSLITEAVTGKIKIQNGKVCGKYENYKDSGVEWIGKIPSGWEVEKSNYIFKKIGDIDHDMPESVENGIPYLMTGDLRERVSLIDFSKCKQVSEIDYQRLSKKMISRKGDILFARYATIGTVSIVDIDKQFLVSYSCVTIRPNSDFLHSDYLFYYFKSKPYFEEIKQFINSNTQGNVGIDSMKKAKIIVPSIKEQIAISNYLDKKCNAIDTAIEQKQKLIEKLTEYKKSLIYECVTGKKEI